MLQFTNKDAFFWFKFNSLDYRVRATVARLLHCDLGIKTPYRQWVNRVITRLSLVEGLDYQKVDGEGRKSWQFNPFVYKQLVDSEDYRRVDIILAQSVVSAIVYNEPPTSNAKNWIGMFRQDLSGVEYKDDVDEMREIRREELRLHLEKVMSTYKVSWPRLEYFVNANHYDKECMDTIFRELFSQNYWVRSEPLFNLLGGKGDYVKWLHSIKNGLKPVYGKEYTGSMEDDFPELEFSPNFLVSHELDFHNEFRSPNTSTLFSILRRIDLGQNIPDFEAFMQLMPRDILFRNIGEHLSINIRWKYTYQEDVYDSWKTVC